MTRDFNFNYVSVSEPAAKYLVTQNFAEASFKPTVEMAVTHEDKVLLVVQAGHPSWSLPQGGMLPGETFQDAVERKCDEELGIREIDRITFLGKVAVVPIRIRGQILRVNDVVFSEGKSYFPLRVEVPTSRVYPDLEKIKDAVWRTPRQSAKLVADQKLVSRTTDKPVYPRGQRYRNIRLLSTLR